MFHSIVKAAKALDNFLTDCEEYVEQRVWNGLFIYDLKFLSSTTVENVKDTYHNTTESILSSSIYTTTLTFFHKFTKLLMQIQIIEDVVTLIVEGFRLCVKYFAHYLIILIVGLASTFLLLMTFKYAPLLFMIILLPVLFGNHLFLSSFFVLAEKKEDGVRFTLWEALTQIKQTLRANTFLFLQQGSIVVTLSIFLFGFAFLLSFLFGTININWSSSFLYWLPVVMVGLLVIILVYISEVIISFSFTFVLQEKKTVLPALNRSLLNIQTDARHSMIFYFILTMFAFIFISTASKNNYEGGFAISIFFMTHAFLFLGFLLRKKYFYTDTPVVDPLMSKIRLFLKPALGVGLLSYIAFSALLLQLHPDIMLYLAEQRPTVAANYEYTSYQNNEAGYIIEYPKPWSVYRWNDTSITIYTNATETDAGGIKVNIEANPAENSNYFTLYEANPGLISYDSGTKNVTTKIANVIIKGKNAVKYTYTKTDTSQTEYQTHYLIRNNDIVYDISFVTASKKIEAAYKDIFDRILESFQFLTK